MRASKDSRKHHGKASGRPGKVAVPYVPQRVSFQAELAGLLEIIECKVTDEEVRALAKRVERIWK